MKGNHNNRKDPSSDSNEQEVSITGDDRLIEVLVGEYTNYPSNQRGKELHNFQGTL